MTMTTRIDEPAVPQPTMTGDTALAELPGTPTQSMAHDLRILQSMRRITRAIELHSRELLAGHNVTGPQLVCLLAIRDRGPLTATAIAYQVHLSSSTVVGILDRLEEKGLARRERDLKDRRQIYVLPTPQGIELASRAPSPLRETLAKALHNLPELERVAIALSLERVAELMETREQPSIPSQRAPARGRQETTR